MPQNNFLTAGKKRTPLLHVHILRGSNFVYNVSVLILYILKKKLKYL